LGIVVCDGVSGDRSWEVVGMVVKAGEIVGEGLQVMGSCGNGGEGRGNRRRGVTGLAGESVVYSSSLKRGREKGTVLEKGQSRLEVILDLDGGLLQFLQQVFLEKSPSKMVLHQLTSKCSHHSLYPDNTVEYVVARMQSQSYQA
nr:hypothetical protein [Tanacetum cinerariifolium]